MLIFFFFKPSFACVTCRNCKNIQHTTYKHYTYTRYRHNDIQGKKKKDLNPGSSSKTGERQHGGKFFLFSLPSSKVRRAESGIAHIRSARTAFSTVSASALSQ